MPSCASCGDAITLEQLANSGQCDECWILCTIIRCRGQLRERKQRQERAEMERIFAVDVSNVANLERMAEKFQQAEAARRSIAPPEGAGTFRDL